MYNIHMYNPIYTYSYPGYIYIYIYICIIPSSQRFTKFKVNLSEISYKSATIFMKSQGFSDGFAASPSL